MENEYWEKEEFEDLVARSLIGLYENKIKKHRGSAKHKRFNIEKLKYLRKIGCYFSSHDRIVCVDRMDNEFGTLKEIQTIDMINDGRPDYAVLSSTPNIMDNTDDDSMEKDSYLINYFLHRIKNLPKGVKCDADGRKYEIIQTWNRNNYIEGHCSHVVITSKGEIYPTYWFRPNYDPITGKCPIEKVCADTCSTEDEKKRCQSPETGTASMIIQFWQDRRFLWNVTASENIAKSTFSVYPEQIKSLFYAREMPMTETGRKRPILHWVAAHHRRLKNGIDVDIEKHLRGINEFVYQGTKFIITRPIKIIK